jgi:hypothetical protein
MISITTKYLGPSNVRGARVSAQVSDYGLEQERFSRENGNGGRLVVYWNHAHNPEENHRLAAFALAKRLGWDGEWIGGDSAGSSGYTFVRNLSFAPRFTVEHG